MAVEIKVIKRRKLSKAERTEIHNKYDGHCAYCGCEIDISKMQVDHVKPLRIGGTDTMDNMMPACRSCNHYKATFDVEGFRNYLSGISHRLMRDSIPFQVGIRFGLIKHMKDDVTFYFETESRKRGKYEQYVL